MILNIWDTDNTYKTDIFRLYFFTDSVLSAISVS